MKGIRTIVAAMSLALAAPTVVLADEIYKLDYDGFTVWLNCDLHGAVKFRYNAQHDTGNLKREKAFTLDPNVPTRCQQSSSGAYKAKGQRYDRGHLVPANHLDHSKRAIHQSNYMTNILPQAANMNRGAWLQTEEITECYRDIDELLVLGGVIWGKKTHDDYFVHTHGVATPDAFWKVIIRKDRVIAWLIPNSQEATRNNLDSYLISIKDLEKVTGETIPVANYLKDEKPTHSWYIPVGCNKG